MATYVIGDIQGCYDALRRLLDRIQFDATQDRLWLTGDLVNRGPDNLNTLRFLKNLGDSVITVLGNHDLHLLGVQANARQPGKKDTLQDVLTAPDRDELLDWLRHHPLVYREGPYVLSHAGIPHIWSAQEAEALSNEVTVRLQQQDFSEFLQNMYGNVPARWDSALEGDERLRVIVNYLTRMRFIAPDGTLDFESKKGSNEAPPGMRPWYDYPHADTDRYSVFLFGHWAALEGITGRPRFIALDTGCVWGEKLTALRLDDNERFDVPAAASTN
jgi:bis(5'-nucleosyl)-tetraphosphatase (symmetrical)